MPTKRLVSMEAILLLNNLLHAHLSRGTTVAEHELAEQAHLFLRREIHRRRENDFVHAYYKQEEAKGRKHDRWRLKREAVEKFRSEYPLP